MNILIVDDDIFTQKFLSFHLLEKGYTVSIAKDGQEAIQLIEKNKNTDVIFCDVMMPVLTGPSFLLLLKKIFPKKLPLIIVISGVKDGAEFLAKLEVPYDHFLKKPIDPQDLDTLLNKLPEAEH